jgi:hypothetical protein
MEYKIEAIETEDGNVFQVVDQDGNIKSSHTLRRDAVNDIKLLNAEGPDALMPKPEADPVEEITDEEDEAEPLEADGTVDEDAKLKRKK